MKRLLKFVGYVLLPILAIIVLFVENVWYGLLGVLVYLAWAVWSSRSAYYGARAQIQAAQGNLDSASAWLEKAYKNGTATIGQAITYSYWLLKKGDTEEAAKVLERIRKIPKLSKQDEMNAAANYAIVLWKQGKPEDAIEMLDKQLQTTRNTTLYGSLGYFLLLHGDLERAHALNLEAYEYNNTDKTILDNLALSWQKLGEYEKSLDLYEQLIAHQPKFPEAYYGYAVTLYALGRREEAYNAMKRAGELEPSVLRVITSEDIEAKLAEWESSDQQSSTASTTTSS